MFSFILQSAHAARVGVAFLIAQNGGEYLPHHTREGLLAEIATRHKAAAFWRACRSRNIRRENLEPQSEMREAVANYRIEFPVAGRNRRMPERLACIKTRFPAGARKTPA